MREPIEKHARWLRWDHRDFCDYMIEDWSQTGRGSRSDESRAAEQKIADEWLSVIDSVSEMECVDSDLDGGAVRFFLSAPLPPLDQVSDHVQDWNDVEAGMSFYDVGVEIGADGESWWFGANDEDGGEAFPGVEGRGKEDFKAAFERMADSLGIKATPAKPAALSMRHWFETREGSGRYEQEYSEASGLAREIGDAILFWPDGVSWRNMSGHPAAYVLNKRHMHPCQLFYYKDGSAEYHGSDYYRKEPWLFD